MWCSLLCHFLLIYSFPLLLRIAWQPIIKNELEVEQKEGEYHWGWAAQHHGCEWHIGWAVSGNNITLEYCVSLLPWIPRLWETVLCFNHQCSISILKERPLKHLKHDRSHLSLEVIGEEQNYYSLSSTHKQIKISGPPVSRLRWQCQGVHT